MPWTYYVAVFGLTFFVIVCTRLSEHYRERKERRVGHTLTQVDENKSVIASTLAAMGIILITLVLAVPLTEPLVDSWERWEINYESADETGETPYGRIPGPPRGP